MLELAQSVERDGIIQPIIVRRVAVGEYQIKQQANCCWRQANLAGLSSLATFVRPTTRKVLEELLSKTSSAKIN